MIVKNRIKKHAEFQKVIENGLLERSAAFYMYYLNNTLGYTRVGISVPKKSGNAVVRNKIKRQMRAILAINNDYSRPLDVVFIVRKGYSVDKFDFVKKEMFELIEKLGK